MKAKLRDILSIIMVIAVILTFSIPAGAAFAGTTGGSKDGGSIFSTVSADWSVDGSTVSLEMNVESDSEVEVVDAHICPAGNTEDGYYTDIICGEFEGEIKNSESSPREWLYEAAADISGIRYAGQGEYNICVTLENDKGQQTFMLSDFGMEDINLGYDPMESDMKIGDKISLEDPIYGVSAFRGDGKVIKNVAQESAKVSFEFENAGIGYIYEYDKDSFELKNIYSYGVLKNETVLKFESESVTKTTSDASFINSISKNTDADVSYSSSDEDVAAVDPLTGEVNILNIGTANITAKAPETENYCSCEATYTLRVIKEPLINISDITYGFKNFSSDIPVEICQYMYGNNLVAREVYEMNIGASGDCFGMATTSSILYEPNDVTAGDFSSSAEKISDLKLDDMNDELGINIKEFIQAMQVSQVSVFMPQTKVNEFTDESVDFMKMLQNETENGRPVLLCMSGKVSGGRAGHAVTAYGFEEIDDNEYKVMIYDSNYPDEERYLYIHKKEDAYGEWCIWDYEIADKLKWGSEYNSGAMQYTTYDGFYEDVWQHHGRLTHAEYNMINVNSDNFSLYDPEYMDGEKPIAQVVDGILETESDEIREVTPMSFNPESIESTQSIVLLAPVENYVLKNDEEAEGDFEATIVNKSLGVTVSTEGDEMSIAADDEASRVKARITADDKEKYQITVRSSRLGDASFVEYSGTGDGSDLSIRYINGNAPQLMGNVNIVSGEKNSLDFSAPGISAVLSNASYVHDGKAKTPAVTIYNYGEVLDSSNYTVSYRNNVKKGTAAAVVTGTGNCSGSITLYFDITNKNAAKKQAKAEEKAKKKAEKGNKKK